MKSTRRLIFIFSFLLLLGLVFSPVAMYAATTITFTGEELLGKPTDTSITINIVPDSTIEYYYDYGTEEGGPYPYPVTISPVTATGGQPHEVVITGLSSNTRYYYRMRYHAPGDEMDDWVIRDEHTFHTQRAEGSTFKFTIISDSHAGYNAQYQQAIQNVIDDQPDFHFDLGDTFMTDSDTEQSQVNAEYLAQRDPLYIGGVGPSAPIFLASGNHENEEGWNFDDSFSIALASVKARKLYFPTPIDEGPDGFYSGNTDPLTDLDAGTYGDQYREDYYAWTWGDALFIVFDPFQYTMTNPYGASAGEGSDDPASGDRWNWTLGQDQYNWLKGILEANKGKKYKFMFAHHMVGGLQNYVRGGAVPAHMFEWGGYNADGTTWGFETQRGWDDPIRQLMIDNGVSAFFHGHDHQYAYEVRDGIVYQSLPRPSTGLDFNFYSENDTYTERVLSSPGHLRVTVTPNQAAVEYVSSSSSSQSIQHSYTILPNPISSDPTIKITGVPLSEFTNEPGTPSAEQSYTVSGSNLTDDITITAPDDFEISETSGSGWTSSPLTLTQSGGSVSPTTIYVRFNRATEGTSSGNIEHISSGATTQNIAVSGTAGPPSPEITISGIPLSAFSSEPGMPSAEKSYTVSGSNLTDDITITPPSNFEISLTSGSGWTSSSLTLTQSDGSVAETDIYVRFNRATEGTSSGNITHTSSGAITQNVAVSGTAYVPGSIAYLGDIGTATIQTSGNSLTVTTDEAVAEGNTIIIGYVTDPAQDLVISVSDSVGNTYKQAALSVNWGNGRSYIFYARAENPLPSGGTITITGDQSVVAKAAVITVFSGLADVNVLDQSLGNPALEDQTSLSGTSPTVGPTGTTKQMNELVIGVIGTNGPEEDDAGTWDNDFTAGPRISTTLDTAADNWTVSLGYKMVSETGAYTAQKSGVTSRNWAATIATFKTENTFNILLGRPTDDSVTVNALLDQSGEAYFEYGTESGSYTSGPTEMLTAEAGECVEVEIDGLDPDTQYFYRMVYRETGSSTWFLGTEHSFHTQRAQDETFTFTITSDSHLNMMGSSDRYNQTTLNITSDHPDFHIDLGDSFIMNDVENQTDADDVYLAQRPYFGNYSHSSPVFLVLGNHEMEKGWNFDNSPSKALLGMTARKKFFLNPVTDGIYSGNDDPLAVIGGDELQEDYYAWTWGDALFIVLDPFHYTMKKPYSEDPFGEGETDIGDQWDWTLGQEQYEWFKQTLEESNAKFKFVFAHHVTGGVPDEYVSGVGPGYVRRGADAAPYFEWGGQNGDGTWGFFTEREWGVTEDHPNGTSIHQLMVDNHVSAFFHGHDHQYAYEKRDEIVYQAVPSSSMDDGGFGLYSEDDPYTLKVLDNAGHLRVTVADDLATVEYVRSAISGDTGVSNGEISYSYTIEANMPVNNCPADIEPNGGDGDVDGADLVEWMGGSSSISLEDFALEFGRMDCLQ